MRSALLALLRCPECAPQGRLALADATEGLAGGHHAEIRSGSLTCEDCGRRYAIEAGIADLLPDPCEALARERAGIDAMYGRELSDEARAHLLRQPYVEDPAHPGHWISVAAEYERLQAWLRDDRREGEQVLLDLGAGSCYSSAAFAATGFTVIALDISTNRRAGLGAAEVRFEDGAPLFDRVVADMQALPLADESVDGAVTLASLHHALDLDAALAAVWRVLKPGGFFYAVCEQTRGLLRHRSPGAHEIERFGWNEHAYTRAAYGQAFRRAGFRYTMPVSAAIGARLEQGIYGSSRLNRVLGTLAAPFWRVGLLRSLFGACLFPLAQPLLGLSMGVRATKPRTGGDLP